MLSSGRVCEIILPSTTTGCAPPAVRRPVLHPWLQSAAPLGRVREETNATAKANIEHSTLKSKAQGTAKATANIEHRTLESKAQGTAKATANIEH
jgi:hypothetical protein